MGIFIGFLIFGFFIVFIFSFFPRRKYYYKCEWYDKECEKIGEDYYVPPAKSHSDLQSDGTYIKYMQHYKPIDMNKYFPSNMPMVPWFVEVYRCSGGRSKFIERYFGKVK